MILDKTYLGSTEIEKIYLGNDVVYELTPVVTNLYSWSDAGTPIPNESDAVVLSTTDGWEVIQGIEPIVSSNIEFQGGGSSGIYSIELKSTLAGASDYGRLNFTIENGASYRFTFWAKTDANGDGDSRLRTAGGWLVNPTEILFNTTWTEYTFDVVANDVAGYFDFWLTRNGALLNTLWIDNITMIKL